MTWQYGYDAMGRPNTTVDPNVQASYTYYDTQGRATQTQQPANTEAQIKLANLLVNQKKVEDALKVLEANAVDPAVAKRRVEVLLNAGRIDDAAKALDKILEKTPSAVDMLQMSAIEASMVYLTAVRPEKLPRKPLPPPQPAGRGGRGGGGAQASGRGGN